MNLASSLPKRDDRGVVAIEFVLVAPILIALVFAIACFGMWFSQYVQVTGDARDVARSIALGGPSWNPATAVIPSKATIASYTPCPATTSTSYSTSSASVTLTYNGNALISIPGVPLSPPTITAKETMPCGG